MEKHQLHLLPMIGFADVHCPVGDCEDEKAQREDNERDLVQPAPLRAGIHQRHVGHVAEAVNTEIVLGIACGVLRRLVLQ